VDVTTVRQGDRLAECQSQAGTASVPAPASLDPEEALKDVGQVFWRNSCASIGHTQHAKSILTTRAQTHTAALVRMGEGIVDQVDQQLSQTRLIAIQDNIVLCVSGECDPAFCRKRRHRIGDRSDQFTRVKSLRHRQSVTRVGARKHQQIASIRADVQHKFTTELARTAENFDHASRRRHPGSSLPTASPTRWRSTRA